MKLDLEGYMWVFDHCLQGKDKRNAHVYPPILSSGQYKYRDQLTYFSTAQPAMGFVCFPSSSNVLPNAFINFIQLFDLIIKGFSAVLYRLCLNPSFAADPLPWDNEEMLFSAEPAPSVAATAASVKSRLPAVEYMSLVNRREGGAAAQECVVCLQLLEARDEVRELGNCYHTFHVACIDRWVDLGRLNCPMCRSALLPKTAGCGPLWFLKNVVAGS